MAALAGLALQALRQLPSIESLNSYVPSESTILYSADGKILARFHQEENRQVVPLSQISPYLQKAVIATEDPRFYQHHGLDFQGIIRARIKNLAYGRVVEGGSTITQQLTRNLFLTKKKTMARKLGEALLALQMERRYTKEEILELYLNQVYLGHNAYGIESAANLYFGKHAADLDLAEAAMIAGLIRGPEIYSPYRNFNGAKLRQIFVINRMLDQGLITEDEGKRAAIEALDFSPKNLKRFGEMAPYFISLFAARPDRPVRRGHGLPRRAESLHHARHQACRRQPKRPSPSFVVQEGKKYNFRRPRCSPSIRAPATLRRWSAARFLRRAN